MFSRSSHVLVRRFPPESTLTVLSGFLRTMRWRNSGTRRMLPFSSVR